MDIEYSTLHIRSLISSKFNVYTSHFEIINIIKGSVQTNNLIDVMNPLMMCSPLIYPFHNIHSLHPNVYDRILRLANGAIKPVRTSYTKQLGLYRQPLTGITLPVDEWSILPVNKWC
jgi:hypothetical protein